MKITIKTNDIIFVILLFLYIFFASINNSWAIDVLAFPQKILPFLLFCMLVNEMIRNTKISKTDFIESIIFLTIGVTSYIMSGSLACIQIVIFCIACRNKEYHYVLRCFLFSISFSFIFIIVLNQLHVLPTYTYTRMDAGVVNQAVRYSFGFIHPNFFSAYIIAIIFLLLLLIDPKYKLLLILIPLAGSYITYKYPVSYTATTILLLTFLYELVSLFWGIFKTHSNILPKLIKHILLVGIPVGIIIVIVIASRSNQNKFLLGLSSTVNGRLFYANLALKKYGISILGQKIETFGTAYFITHKTASIGYFTIDLMYVLLAVRDGLIASVVIFYILLVNIKKSIENRSFTLTAELVLLCFYSLLETGLINAIMIFIFIYCSTMTKTTESTESIIGSKKKVCAGF